MIDMALEIIVFGAGLAAIILAIGCALAFVQCVLQGVSTDDDSNK